MGDEPSVVTNTTCNRALLRVDSLLCRLVGSVPLGLDFEIFFPPTQSLKINSCYELALVSISGQEQVMRQYVTSEPI